MKINEKMDLMDEDELQLIYEDCLKFDLESNILEEYEYDELIDDIQVEEANIVNDLLVQNELYENIKVIIQKSDEPKEIDYELSFADPSINECIVSNELSFEVFEYQHDIEVLHHDINRILKFLTPREEKVIRCYFGIGEEQKSIEQIAQDFFVVSTRIGQILTRAILKLKNNNETKKVASAFIGFKSGYYDWE